MKIYSIPKLLKNIFGHFYLKKINSWKIKKFS